MAVRARPAPMVLHHVDLEQSIQRPPWEDRIVHVRKKYRFFDPERYPQLFWDGHIKIAPERKTGNPDGQSPADNSEQDPGRFVSG